MKLMATKEKNSALEQLEQRQQKITTLTKELDDLK